MTKKVINASAARLPVGGVTIAPGESAEVEQDDEVQELLEGGALVPDNHETRRRFGLDDGGEE